MKLRIARHTNQLEKIRTFYIETLNFESLGSFFDHNGYDGLFLGFPEASWHLEFTQSADLADHHPDPDDLLVLYPGNDKYHDFVEQLIKTGIEPISSKNPYWSTNGFHFLDPDGFGIVIGMEPV